MAGGCGSDKSTGGDGGPAAVSVQGEVPEFLAGVWSVEIEIKSCSIFDPFLLDTTVVDTVCLGDLVFDYESLYIGDIETTVYFDCDGTITDTSIDVECVSSGTSQDGCSATMTMTFEGDLDSLMWTLEQTTDLDFRDEGCSPQFRNCNVQRLTFTRIGDAPPECDGAGTSSARGEFTRSIRPPRVY
jgi:hypothetical protein